MIYSFMSAFSGYFMRVVLLKGKNGGSDMYIVLVQVKVNKADIESFISATEENAGKSRREKGVLRFDIYQNEDDPTSFILHEVYRSKQATTDHKETEHYKKWRETVADLMEQPRSSKKYHGISPLGASNS